MALKHMFSGMAGVPAFFSGAFSKNYGDVTKRSRKWFDTSADQTRRQAETLHFQRLMASNPNLTPQDMKLMGAGYSVRQFIGKTGEAAANTVGAGASLMGGTAGYVAKNVAVGTATATAGAAVGAAKLATKTGIAGGKLTGRALKANHKRWATNRAAGKEQRGARNEMLARVGKATAKDAYNIGKGLYNFTGTKTFNAGVAVAAGAAIMGSADTLDTTIGSPGGTGAFGKLVGTADGPIHNMYESGKQQGKGYHTMQQMSSNMTSSMNGGGAFLRDIAPTSAPVDDMGASGDLVFALHSLRNGG